MRTSRFLPALALGLGAAGAGALTMSHVVIRQVSLPSMTCDASAMGPVVLNAFAVSSLCSAYVSCDGGGDPVEFTDLSAVARDQARDINCANVCRCLPRPAAREPVAVANGTEVHVVNATVAHSIGG